MSGGADTFCYYLDHHHDGKRNHNSTYLELSNCSLELYMPEPVNCLDQTFIDYMKEVCQKRMKSFEISEINVIHNQHYFLAHIVSKTPVPNMRVIYRIQHINRCRIILFRGDAQRHQQQLQHNTDNYWSSMSTMQGAMFFELSPILRNIADLKEGIHEVIITPSLPKTGWKQVTDMTVFDYLEQQFGSVVSISSCCTIGIFARFLCMTSYESAIRTGRFVVENLLLDIWPTYRGKE